MPLHRAPIIRELVQWHCTLRIFDWNVIAADKTPMPSAHSTSFNNSTVDLTCSFSNILER